MNLYDQRVGLVYTYDLAPFGVFTALWDSLGVTDLRINAAETVKWKKKKRLCSDRYI